MSGTLKRWQTKIEINDPINDFTRKITTTCLYGETIESLRLAAQTYLQKNNPLSFYNVGDYITGKLVYFCQKKRYTPLRYSHKISQNPLEEGWWYKKVEVGEDLSEIDFEENPKKLTDFSDAVQHFINFALIPEKGPDYQSKAVIGGNLRLPFVEKVLRETAENPINDFIQRGWHILALEYKGEVSLTGELMNRKAIFVMGHPEGKIASLTLNTEYFKNALNRIG